MKPQGGELAKLFTRKGGWDNPSKNCQNMFFALAESYTFSILPPRVAWKTPKGFQFHWPRRASNEKGLLQSAPCGDMCFYDILQAYLEVGTHSYDHYYMSSKAEVDYS